MIRTPYATSLAGLPIGGNPALSVRNVIAEGGLLQTCFLDADGLQVADDPMLLPDPVLVSMQHAMRLADQRPISFYRGGQVWTINEEFLADVTFVDHAARSARCEAAAASRTRLADILREAAAKLGLGWRVRFLFTGFEPLHLLELQHVDGRQATWYFGEDATFLSHQIDAVPDALRRAVSVFGARKFLADDPAALTMRGFGLLNARVRLELEAYFPSLPSQPLPAHLASAAWPASEAASESPLIALPARERLDVLARIVLQGPRSALPRLGEGWLYRDHAWWASSPCSVASFPPAGPVSAARLRIAFEPGRGRRIVTVTVNGWEVGRSVIDPARGGGARRDFWIPPEALYDGAVRCVLSFDAQSDHHACMVRSIELAVGARREAVATGDPSALLARFENLGDNCEFGLVQRYFGAEPMGLLRFADVGDLGNLMRLLECRFDGLGDPGTLTAETVRSIAPQENAETGEVPEFLMTDLARRYSFHTWKGPHDHDEHAALSEAESKLSYLRRKTIERLEQASRIWVFKRASQTDLHEILALHAALRDYGPNRLFWVRAARPGRPVGAVEWIADGLLCGYSDQDHRYPHIFEPQTWLTLCQNACRAFGRL